MHAGKLSVALDFTDVGGRDRDCDGGLAHHGVALDGRCDPLGSGDHLAQAPFNGLAGFDR